MSVYPHLETLFPGGLDFWSKSVSLILAYLKTYCGFSVSKIVLVLNFFWSVVYLQTSLLCLMGELAGGGFVAVAVGVSFR